LSGSFRKHAAIIRTNFLPATRHILATKACEYTVRLAVVHAERDHQLMIARRAIISFGPGAISTGTL